MEWISVKERFPEDGDLVNVAWGHQNSNAMGVFYADGMYQSDKKGCNKFFSMSDEEQIGITHWMPLPEPPKGA